MLNTFSAISFFRAGKVGYNDRNYQNEDDGDGVSGDQGNGSGHCDHQMGDPSGRERGIYSEQTRWEQISLQSGHIT